MDGSMLIDGQLVAASDDGWLDAHDPSNGQLIGRFPAATTADVTAAVDAAERAWPDWFGAGIDVRYAAVTALADSLEDDLDELVDLEVRDSGNTVDKVRGDVRKAARALRHFAELAYEAQGSTVPGDGDHLHLTVREPYGVVARIVPFNHPIMFAASRIAAPLLTGNAVVVKAPEQASLSICRFAERCRELFPAGVVNIVTGTGVPVGDALVRDPRVRRVAFTGSVGTGRAIMRAAGESSIKQLSLELGGKNPFILLPDANVDRAIRAAVAGMNFAWQGQSCGSTSRLLVHENLYERVVAEIGDRVGSVRLGDPGDPDTDMGPLVSEEQLERVAAGVERAVEQGARLVTGGARPSGDGFARGNWYLPTVLADVTPEHEIFHTELFGPVLAVTSFRDEAHALELANGVDVGLTAAIWTEDLRTAMRLMTRVRAGYVWVNDVARRYRGTPFGGFGDSGVGREEGLEELASYAPTKTVHVNFG